MAKYLRYLSYDFTDADGRPDPAMWAAVADVPEVNHLCWMYEHHALPMKSNGVAKVNLFFTAEELDRDPGEVLEIAHVFERFDLQQLLSGSPKSKQQYFLDRFHGGMLRCASQFGWDPTPLVAARKKIIEDDFHFSFFWKKPLSSPDRKIKVQAFVQVSPMPAHLYLIFFDRKMSEFQRTLLSIGTDGPGMLEFVLGSIRWLDSETVRVQHENQRDYWLVTPDGGVEFHFPRADDGDPHGEYELGKMYLEGRYVLADRDRGLDLIQSAADKGFKHAINLLARQP